MTSGLFLEVLPPCARDCWGGFQVVKRGPAPHPDLVLALKSSRQEAVAFACGYAKAHDLPVCEAKTQDFPAVKIPYHWHESPLSSIESNRKMIPLAECRISVCNGLAGALNSLLKILTRVAAQPFRA